MPHIPHEYAVRKKWIEVHGITFTKFVKHIRQYGNLLKWGKHPPKPYWNLNGYKYWCLFASDEETTIINRAEVEDEHPYDFVADDYDTFFNTPEAQVENDRVMKAIGYKDGEVLDIGCGTGLFLDYNPINTYLGIDPSRRMLEKLKEHHNYAEFICTPFESFGTSKKFDIIVCLFGSLNYIDLGYIQRIPRLLVPGGQYHVMVASEDYIPITHKKFGIEVEFYHHPVDVLPGTIEQVTEYYYLISGKS